MAYKNFRHRQEKWAWELDIISRHIIGQGYIHPTGHFLKRCHERNLSVEDALSIFHNGTAEIIQAHAIGTYGMPGGDLNKDEVRVIYGVTDKGTVIHLIMALDAEEGMLKATSIYEPSLAIFKEDLKTLR